MQTMQAARYLAPNQIEAQTISVPNPGPGEALVKVDACGICGSDVYIVSGKHPRAKAPLTIGHEFSGAIVEMGKGAASTTSLQVGDRVTAYPLISCGECYCCRKGLAHACRTLRLFGIDTEGGMAEYVKIPVERLFKLPKTMSAEVGAMIEPLAVGIHAVNRTEVEPDFTAVVLGAGPIGLLNALVLKNRGLKQVFVTDVNPFRLELVKKLGMTPLHATEQNVVETVKAATDGEGADVVFEAVGLPAAAMQMTDLARNRGTIVVVGVFKQPVEVQLPQMHFKELSIIGTRVYTREDYQEAIDIAESLPLQELVTHRYPLSEVSSAFELFRSGADSCKVLLTPQ